MEREHRLVRIADNESGREIRPGDFFYRTDRLDGRIKWIEFWIPGQRAPFQASIAPQKNACGASWTLSGDPDRPTLHPSVNVKDIWHGWIRDGVAVAA